MARKSGKKASNILVWALLGLLMVALTGFGITSFSGSASRVGSVGNAEITAEDYARALQDEISARISETGQRVNLASLRAEGIDQAVLQGLVARAALANEAMEMGVSVGDAAVADQITAIPGFQDANGQFDRLGYEFAIGQRGLTPAEFEEDVREDISRSILQIAVIGGVAPPPLFAEAIAAHQGETRDFTLLRLGEDDLPGGLAEPTDAELQAHYEDNAERFTRPEAREISYAWITPAMLMDEIEIAEETLRALYDDRTDIYILPERRLVERLVFSDLAEAEEARAALDAGDTSFDDLVEARGLSLEDVDMGDVTRTDLVGEAAEAVFADEDAEIVGPVESAFGPALFRINAVLNASETTFEEAREDLRIELATEAARREIAALREDVDDLLAGGATLEELADETALVTGTLTLPPADGGSEDDGIAGYDAFRDAAQAAREGDFAEVLDLSDGGIFALRLDRVVPPTLPPLAEIRDDVAASWRSGALRDALAARAQELVAELATSGTALEEMGGEVQTETLIRRQDFIPDAPPTLVGQVFQLDAVGDTVVIPAAGAAYIARLDAINAAVRDATDVALLLQIIEAQVGQSMAQDVFESFGRAMEGDVGIRLDQGVINAVHASFP